MAKVSPTHSADADSPKSTPSKSKTKSKSPPGQSPSPPNKSLTPRTSKRDYVFRLWSHLFDRLNPILSKNPLKFEDLTKSLHDKTLILLTAKFCDILDSFCSQTPFQPKKAPNLKKARVMLSSVMITKFPSDVLDISDMKNMDARSENCLNSAKGLTEALFSSAPGKLKNTSKLHCETVKKAMDDFLAAFVAWQTTDVSKVLAMVVNYYGQWRRSHKVLEKSSMNEAQKTGVLRTLKKNMIDTRRRICKLVGIDKANEICAEIDKIIDSEVEHETLRNSVAKEKQNTNGKEEAAEQKANGSNSNSQQKTKTKTKANSKTETTAADVEEEKKEEPKELSIEEQLRRKGIPANIRSGRNLVRELPNASKSKANGKAEAEAEGNESSTSKYIKDVDGKKMMDLDMILMEEASKKYWNDFMGEVEKQNFSRLFSLLTELLTRIKKMSPAKDHQNLDEMIDVEFIKQTIDHGVIDGKGFYGIFYGIWKQIKSLHAPAEDKAWDEWHEEMVEKMGANDATWAKVLPTVFNKFLMKLDRIEDAIQIVAEIKKSKKQ